MAKSYGTLQLLDELRVADNDNIFTYGEDTLLSSINDILEAHNRLASDFIDDFVERTTTKIARFGAEAVTGEMIDVDEYGAVDVQKTTVAGYDIGWPLRRSQFALGWTMDWLETHSVADMAIQMTAAMDADIRGIKKRALDALFRATNYNFIDRLDDQVTLPVKALQNADGTAIPVDEFGNTFNGATHTHLVGRAGGSVVAADISALLLNVTEHGVNGGEVVLYINVAQEATIRGFTSNFSALQAPLLDPGPGSTANIVDGGRKNDPYSFDDKLIGIWDGYVRVYVKPWMPANYYLAWLTNDGRRGEVVRMRVPGGLRANRGDFRLVATHRHFPLEAEHFQREMGFGVWNRLGAAILYGGGTSYVQPTIAL